MSEQRIRIPVLVSSWLTGFGLKAAPANYDPTPTCEVSYLESEIARDAHSSTVRVDLRTGKWWSCRFTFDATIAVAKTDEELTMLAWYMAGDPTPDITSKALSERDQRIELLRGQLAGAQQALREAVAANRAWEAQYGIYAAEE